MPSLQFANPEWELVFRLVVNVIALILLIFGMYYRRYRDKELATARPQLEYISAREGRWVEIGG